jgi:prepilin-type N-terminal cleavage/methylation domain-containing protein
MRKRVHLRNDGFTLVEIIVVMAILSVMAIALVPRISAYFGGGRGDLISFQGFVAKTFDTAFLRNETCYLAIHCYSQSSKPDQQDVLTRENGLSVLVMSDENGLVESKRRVLSKISFPDSFKIEEVVLSTGEIVRSGTALVSFSADGYSDDTIVHILIHDMPYSILIYKHLKSPKQISGTVSMDDMRKGNIQ